MEREPYWDYMGRRLREEWNKETWSMDDMYKKEVSEMQSSIHVLQMRIKTLSEQVLELNTKVEILGGDPRQLEFRF
jgi:polyhydroxyalkanoate synthesis regulator phasin